MNPGRPLLDDITSPAAASAPSLADLLGIIAPPAWTEEALCAQVDPDLWFPEKGGSPKAAKAICRACPVRQSCLDYSLANQETSGIWGGLTYRERREHRHTQEAAA